MTYITIIPLTCFSHLEYFKVSEDVLDDLSQLKYDSEGGAALLRNAIAFVGLCHRDEVPSDNIACGLFAYTFERCVQ